MTTAIVCTALLGLLLFALGFGVSMTRSRTGTLAGYTPDPADQLYRIVRAHGNTAEYAPMFGVLMLLLGARDPATWVLWTMGIATASRYLLVVGILSAPLEPPHPLRFLGALGTYLSGLALCVAAFLAF